VVGRITALASQVNKTMLLPRWIADTPTSLLISGVSNFLTHLIRVCCNVLQCVAVRCCDVLQCVAVCLLQCVTVCCSVLQQVAPRHTPTSLLISGVWFRLAQRQEFTLAKRQEFSLKSLV
jgi:hypothetical protein